MSPDDKPDEKTINNDKKFDRWYEDFSRKMERDAAQRSMHKVGQEPPTFEDIPSFRGN